MNLCSDITTFYKPEPCDGDLKGSIKKVLYNPETGHVFDENKNYIGQGELKDGVLKIILNSQPPISDTLA